MKHLLIAAVILCVCLGAYGGQKVPEALTKGDKNETKDTNAQPDATPADSAETDEQKPKPEDLSRLKINADHYDFVDQDLLILKGNVFIQYQNLELYADRVEYYRDRQVVVAEGSVLFRQLTDEIRAGSLEFNLSNSTGRIIYADGYISDAFYIKGDQIYKESDTHYSFNDCELSSCDDDHRLWFFSSTGGTITQEDYARLKNVVLWFLGVPIFYTPYLVYPVKSERSTGFLVPTFGYSGSRGFYLRNAFFWAISDYVDTTIEFDYFSEQGYTAGLEFRYVMGEGRLGSLNVDYAHQRNSFFGNIADEPSNRWNIDFMHRHDISHSLEALVQFEYVSDDNYFNLYSWDNYYRTKESLGSFLSLTYTIGNPRGSLMFLVDSNRDLREEKGEELSRVPEVRYTISRANLFADLYFDLEATVTNFYDRSRERFLQSQTYGNDFVDNQVLRGKAKAALSYSLKPALWFNLTPTVKFWGVYFNKSLDLLDENNNDFNKDLIDEASHYANYAVSVKAEGPKWYHIYGSGDSRLMHLVYPFAEYGYQPFLSSREIPKIDDYYEYDPDNYVKYGIRNSLIYKDGDKKREVASFSIYQSYDWVKKELLDYYSFEPVNRQDEPKSDIYFDLTIYPSGMFDFRSNLRYDPTESLLRSANIDLSFYSTFLRATIGYSYYKPYDTGIDLTGFENTFFGRSNQYLSGNISLKLFDTIGLGVNTSYDFDRKELRNGIFRLAWLHQCFSIQLSAIRTTNYYYLNSQDEWRFEVNFLFLNIGSVGNSTVDNEFVEDWGERDLRQSNVNFW